MSHRLIDAREVPVITTLGTLDRWQMARDALPAHPSRRVAFSLVGGVVAVSGALGALGYVLGSGVAQ